MNGASLVDAVPNLAGAAMLLLGLFLPARRRRESAARLVAWQGGLLALAAASAAWRGGAAAPLLWVLAFGALAGRALPLSALLRSAAGGGGGGGAARGPEPAGSGGASLLLGGGLAVLAVAAVVPAGAAGVPAGTREGLGLALAALLVGLLAMRLRRGVFSGLLGLLAAENGALLGLVHAAGGTAALSGAAAFAVLSPGLVFCAVLAAARGGGVASVPSLLRALRR